LKENFDKPQNMMKIEAFTSMTS